MKTLGLWAAAAGLILAACVPGAGRGGGAEESYAAAAELYGREQFTEALEYAEESLAADKNFYQARLLKGKILFFLKRPEEAEGIFAGLCAAYPEYTEARIWNLRCQVLSLEGPAGGDREKVRAALDRELSFNPSDWRVLYLYALWAGNTGDWEKRLSMGRRAENALSESAKVYLDTALSWHSLGLKDRAALALEKARIVAGGNISLARLAEGTAELIDSSMGESGAADGPDTEGVADGPGAANKPGGGRDWSRGQAPFRDELFYE
jgi:tetratricopeptide (TPR) repeat protein